MKKFTNCNVLVSFIGVIALLVASITSFAQPSRVEGTWRNADASWNSNIGSFAARTAINGTTILAYRNQSLPTSGTRTLLFNESGGSYNPKWVAADATAHTLNTRLTGTTGAGSAAIRNGSTDINFATTQNSYYTFVIGNAAGTNNDLSILETAYNPRDITAVSKSPATVYAGQTVTVSVTLSGAFNTNERLYVYYSTDAFATIGNSAFVQISSLDGSFVGTAEIPAFTNGTTVTYYALTTPNLTPTFADVQYQSLNIFNGTAQNTTAANASYVVQGWVTTGAGGNWGTAGTWTANAIPPTSASMGAVTISGNTTLNADALVSGLTIDNTFTLNGGTGSNTLNIAAGGTFLNNGTYTGNTETINLVGAASFTGATATLNNLTINNGTATLTVVPTINGTLTMNHASATVSAAPIYGTSSTLTYAVSKTVGSEWTAQVDGAATTGRPNHVTVNNGITLTMHASETRAMAGNLSLAAASALNLNGGHFILRGNWNNVGNVLTNASNKTVSFTGVAGQNISRTGGETFYGVTINNADSVVLGSDITVNGELTLTAGAMAIGANTLTLGGTIAAAGAGTLKMAPTSNISISGTGALGSIPYTSGSSTLNNFTLNKTAGGSAKLSSSMTVDGTLTITSGNLDLNGSNNITLGSSATLSEVAGNTVVNTGVPTAGNGYIGISTRNLGANPGDVAGLGLTLNPMWALGNTTIKRFQTATSVNCTGIKRYFEVLPSLTTGPPSDLNFKYDATNDLNGITAANLKLYTSDDLTTWTKETASSVAAPNVSLAGITTLARYWHPEDAVAYISTNNGNWSSAATWACTGVPPDGATVTINSNVTIDQAVDVSNITINSGKTLTGSDGASRTLTVRTAGTFTNSGGTFTATATGTVTFGGSATISGTSTFNNVIINGSVDFGASSTIGSTGTLTMNNGSSVNTNAPAYTCPGATLYIFTSGTYDRNPEWVNTGGTGNGYPCNVRIGNNTTYQLGANGNAATTTEMAGNLTIDAGSTLTMVGGTARTQPLKVYGSVSVNGTLTLSSSVGGDIEVKGDWTRSGTINKNSRSVTFNGTGAQAVNQTENFDYLIINKTAGSSLTLNGPSEVGTGTNTSVLTLTSGNIITTSANILTIGSTSESAISGGSSTSYINGPMQLTLAGSIATAGTYTFPIGKSGFNPYYLITPTTGGTGPVVKAEVFDDVNGGTFNAPITALRSDRYWTSSVTSGNFTSTYIKILDAAATSTTAIGQSTTTLAGVYSTIGGTLSGSTLQSSTLSTAFPAFFVIATVPIPCPTPSCDQTATSGNNYTVAAGEVICIESGTNYTSGKITLNGGTVLIKSGGTLTIDVGAHQSRVAYTASYTTHAIQNCGTLAYAGSANADDFDNGSASNLLAITNYPTGTLTHNSGTGNSFYVRQYLTLVNHGTISTEGHFIVDASATITINDGSRLTVGNELIISGTINNYGQITTEDLKTTGVSSTVNLYPNSLTRVTANIWPDGTNRIFAPGGDYGYLDNTGGNATGYNSYTTSSSVYYCGPTLDAYDGAATRGADCPYPLPIELLYFNAKANNNVVEVTWVTATEINNDYFTIERSVDGFNFEEIGYVQGAGNSSLALNYSFFDRNPLAGISYYRLKQTDYDGQYERFNIVAVNFFSNTLSWALYPNPTNGEELFIKFLKNDDHRKTVTIEINDVLGNLIFAKAVKGNFNTPVNVLNGSKYLAKGIYLVKVMNEDEMTVEKLVIR